MLHEHEDLAEDVLDAYADLLEEGRHRYGSSGYMAELTNLAIDASQMMRAWEDAGDTRHNMYLVAKVLVLHWQRLNSCLLLGHDPEACPIHQQLSMVDIDPEFPTSFE